MSSQEQSATVEARFKGGLGNVQDKRGLTRGEPFNIVKNHRGAHVRDKTVESVLDMLAYLTPL